MRKLRQNGERWTSQICSLIQLKARSSSCYSVMQRKESIMPSRSTHHPNSTYLAHQQQTLQCHQLLLIFSESYALKGWEKCFPKSTERTKKGKKKRNNHLLYTNSTSETELIFLWAEKGWSTTLLGTGWSTTLLRERLVKIFSLTVSKRNGR